MAYNLEFDVNLTGAEALAKVDELIRKLSGSTKAAGTDLNVFEQVLRADIAAGNSLGDALKTIASSGEGTAAVFAQLAREALSFKVHVVEATNATIKLGAAHTAMVPEVAAASAAIRVFEGAMPIRAVERFAVNILGLGPILRTAFPVIGAIALGEVLVSIGGKLWKFITGVRDGAEIMAGAFDKMNGSIRTSDDELRVVGDRLRDEIAKLEHKPENALALSLDEARVAADHLAESIGKDISALNELLKKEGIGRLNGFFTGRSSTNSDQAEVKEFGTRMAGIDRAGLASVRDAKDEKGREAAQAEWNKKAIAALDAEAATFGELVHQSEILDKLNKQGLSPQETKDYVAKYGPVDVTSNESVRLEERRGTLDNLNEIRDRYSQTASNDEAQRRKNALEAAKTPTEANRSDEEAIELQSKLAGIQKSELTGLAAINAEHDALIAKLKEEDAEYKKQHPGAKPNPKDTPRNEALADEIAAAERDKYNQQLAISRSQRQRAAANTGIEQERVLGKARGAGTAEIDLARGKQSGQDESGIESAYQARLSEANQQFQDAARQVEELRKQRDEQQILKPDQDKLEIADLGINEAQRKASGAAALALYDAQKQRILELIALDQKRFEEEISYARSLRTVADASTKADIEDNKAGLQRRAALIAAQEPGPGNELDVLRQQLDLRRQIAAIDREEKQRQIDVQRSESEKILAHNPDDAEAKKKTEADLAALRVEEIENQRGYERELGDERIEIELKVAEIRKQQLEEFRSTIGGLFDAIVNRQPRAVPNFLKSLVLGQAKTFAENAAQEYLFKPLKPLLSGLGSSSPLAKGTWFQASPPDTAKTVDNGQSLLNGGIDWYALDRARAQSTAAMDLNLLTGTSGAVPKNSDDPLKTTAAPALVTAATQLETSANELMAAAHALASSHPAAIPAPLEGTPSNALNKTVNEASPAQQPINAPPASHPKGMVLDPKTLAAMGDQYSGALDDAGLGAHRTALREWCSIRRRSIHSGMRWRRLSPGSCRSPKKQAAPLRLWRARR